MSEYARLMAKKAIEAAEEYIFSTAKEDQIEVIERVEKYYKAVREYRQMEKEYEKK